MNIGGDKTSPETIEAVLAQFPGIDRAGVRSVLNAFGIEEVWAAYVSHQGVNERDLHAFCQGTLFPAFVPRRFMRVPEIPVNEMGKIDRPRLAELLRPKTN
jgi:acyl-CoA synthetase (AMP-forming)/AMP-acid ligase II